MVIYTEFFPLKMVIFHSYVSLLSGYVKQFAFEDGPVEIVDLPSYNMVMFHSYVKVYQRVAFDGMKEGFEHSSYLIYYIHMGLVIPSLRWIFTVQYKNSRHVMDEHTP